MRLSFSVLLLALCLAGGVFYAGSRYSDGGWMAVPAVAVWLWALRRGHVDWQPLVLAGLLVGLVAVSARVSKTGWATAIPAAAFWLSFVVCRSGATPDDPPRRSELLILGVPIVLLTILGTVLADRMGGRLPPGSSFCGFVWCACLCLAVLVWSWRQMPPESRKPSNALTRFALIALTMLAGMSATSDWFWSELAIRNRISGNEEAVAVTLGQRKQPWPTRSLQPHTSEGLELYTDGGYFYRRYLPMDSGAWQPERLPAYLLTADYPVVPDRQLLTCATDVLIYAWPRELGRSGRRTFLLLQRLGGPTRLLECEGEGRDGYSGLARMPAPPDGLGADGRPAIGAPAPGGRRWQAFIDPRARALPR